MIDKSILDEEVKVMKRQFGGMAALVKELEAKVENLEKNQDNVAKIMDKQSIVEDAINANAASIKKLEKEIMDLNIMKQKQLQNDIREDGHCKYKLRCRYFHPRGIFQAYFENGKCDRKKLYGKTP